MSKPKDAIRWHLMIALSVVFCLGGAATALSFIAALESAVVASGFVVVETNVKKVQHPTGGIVGVLNVSEGARVKAGDIVARLDDTVTRTSLAIIMNDLNATKCRRARLLAESRSQSEIVFPPEIEAQARVDRDLETTIEGERRLLTSRLQMRNNQQAQLRERIGQYRQEVNGLKEQLKATDAQLKVAQDELSGLHSLQRKGLAAKPRVSALEREVPRSEGIVGDLTAKISQVSGRILETELQILQLDKDALTEVAKELRDTDTRLAELIERKVAAEDQLKRVDIRAPITGLVHQLNVHTVGGVVNASEPMMLIVPQQDRLIVEVRVNPTDIDQIHSEQQARVKFMAGNLRTTPEVYGSVFRIAADLTREAQSGYSYYLVGIVLDEQEMHKLNGLKLVPGMPTEAFIKTGARTLADYIAKPLVDQMDRALRER